MCGERYPLSYLMRCSTLAIIACAAPFFRSYIGKVLGVTGVTLCFAVGVTAFPSVGDTGDTPFFGVVIRVRHPEKVW
jgi:hypothetical protein